MNIDRSHHRAVECRRSAGFSMVELLVAMTMGLFLIGGMVTVFAGNTQSTELNRAVASMQESARYALDRMSSELRMAGFQGCTSPAGGSITITAASVPMTDAASGLLGTAVFGSRVETTTTWSPLPPYGASFAVPTQVPSVPGTHVLSMQFGSPITGRLQQPVGGNTPSPSGTVRLAGAELSRDLATGKLAIISDCTGGELFRISDSRVDGAGNLNLDHGAPENASGSFATAYGQNGTRNEVRVMGFNAHVYFIGDTGLRNDAGDAITALYKQTLPFGDADNPPSELVQGVENLRLSFGVRGAGQSLRYVQPGDAAFRVEDVRAVRLGLLMSSWEPIADQDDTNVYLLAGQPVGPAVAGSAQVAGDAHAGDRRLRLAFNTTVKVRNFREDGSR